VGLTVDIGSGVTTACVNTSACGEYLQAHELSQASQLHAEAAARDLLAAKKAEMQVLPLLTGGKNPDPAAAELLKAQAAAKCAEQLKVGLGAWLPVLWYQLSRPLHQGRSS